jgi:hypothetical protein
VLEGLQGMQVEAEKSTAKIIGLVLAAVIPALGLESHG